MNKNKAEKYEKMDKLGEGTYGVVYQARGSFTIIQTKKQIRYSHSRRYDFRANKKEFPPQP